MKSGKLLLLALQILLAAGCGGGGSSTPVVQQPTAPPATTAPNVMNVTVNGSLCSSGSYHNKPCVSVTVCTPGTTTCQTINDILLDTGSSGLRIFSQALTVPLTPVSAGTGSLAECFQFVNANDWGPVEMASVILGGEPAEQIPIHVIDSTFGTPPGQCARAEASPAVAGFNGVLGVGLFAQDSGLYFTCSGPTCNRTTVSTASQVQNPVALLSQDNNGLIVEIPAIPATGATFVNGLVVLGIGTRPNNTPSGVTAYPASVTTGDFTTVVNGVTYASFIDSGSNGLFFNAPASLSSQLPVCGTFWYCPSTTLSFTATNSGIGGLPSGQVPFQIGNANLLFGSSNNAFTDLAGPQTSSASSGFDWGLPFFYGRNVFIGIEGKNDPTLGTGPYWAY